MRSVSADAIQSCRSSHIGFKLLGGGLAEIFGVSGDAILERSQQYVLLAAGCRGDGVEQVDQFVGAERSCRLWDGDSDLMHTGAARVFRERG